MSAPIAKSYHGGLSAHIPNAGNAKPSKRGSVSGWTTGATRRLRLFLWSVRSDDLLVSVDGELLHGFSFTLTVRDCPASAAVWRDLVKRWLDRMRYYQPERWQWLTEWQVRKVPHLHGCVWFPHVEGRDYLSLLVNAWVEVAKNLQPASMLRGLAGQCVKPIYDARGWFQYMEKHMARGVAHYQRDSANIPPGWQGKTGRMWSHSRTGWPVDEPDRAAVAIEEFYRLRRRVRSWRIADARAEQNYDVRRRRIRGARRMFNLGDSTRSRTRAFAEAVPRHLHERMAQSARVKYD